MEIEITGIGDKGDLKNERVGFTVLKDCDLKNHLALRTSFNANGFYHKSKDIYWFIPQAVKVGDKIVLYSKSGTASISDNKDGTKTYFYYWGLTDAIFTDAEKGIVLIEAKTWQLSKNK
jgi:hypothetical protein